jgi:hypothetical protein
MITNKTYGIDNDVLAYNARIISAGFQGLSTQSLREINQLVIGLKKLKVWEFLGEGWLCRNVHNVGSGDTLYSLKGNFNATLVGSPDWTTKGLVYPSGNLRYSQTSSSFIPNTEFTLIMDYKSLDSGLTRVYSEFSRNTLSAKNLDFYKGNVGTQYVIRNVTDGLTSTSLSTTGDTGIFRILAWGYNNDTSTARVMSEDRITDSSASLSINNKDTGTFRPRSAGAFGSTGSDGIQSCCFWFNKLLSQTEMLAIKNLLRSTVAQQGSLEF